MYASYAFRTAVNEVVVEKTDRKIEFQVTDADGEPLPAAAIETLTVTVYDRAFPSAAPIADHTSILNANGTTIDGAGNGVLDVKAAWLVTIDDTQEEETRVFLFEWTFASGRKLAGEILLRVANLAKRS